MARKTSKAQSETEAPYAPAYAPMSEPSRPNDRPQVLSAGSVYAEMVDIKGADREHLIVFDLDVRHRIIERRICAIGTLTEVCAHPREIFRPAIKNGAAAIILSHNHPSGDTTPSRADTELTTRVREAGALLGIPLLDHVVVSSGGFVSYADRGWQ